MDAVAKLGAEHVVDEPMLGDAAQATERRRRYNRLKVVAVPGHLGVRARDSGLDPLLKLVRRDAHEYKRSGPYTE